MPVVGLCCLVCCSDGEKHGKGKITFADGASYEGHFSHDFFDGKAAACTGLLGGTLLVLVSSVELPRAPGHIRNVLSHVSCGPTESRWYIGA